MNPRITVVVASPRVMQTDACIAHALKKVTTASSVNAMRHVGAATRADQPLDVHVYNRGRLGTVTLPAARMRPRQDALRALSNTRSNAISRRGSSHLKRRIRRGGRVVECAGLEIQCTFSTYRRFESDPLRQQLCWPSGARQLLRSLWLSVIVLAGCGGDAPIRPFTTDGGSGFPDGTPRQRQIWRACCVAHDRAYWRGGPYNERLEADRLLVTCVAAAGEPTIAQIMLAGVRVGGSPWRPTQFR